MRRADRLFQLIQHLRRRRGVTTAATLAERLEVSERTIYRDVRDLILSGVPIRGEAGVGYALERSFELPPLMFTADEIEALVLGARFVRSYTDPGLAKAADDALGKIETVLPDALRDRIERSVLFSVNFRPSEQTAQHLEQLRGAIRDGRKVRLDYEDGNGNATERIVRPVCLVFMAPRWLMSAWCELRDDFRNFRLDRVAGLDVLEQTFAPERGKTVKDFLRQVTGEED